MMLRKHTVCIVIFFLIGLIFYGCSSRLTGWFIVPENKNAKHYTTLFGESKNISLDKNMDIRFDVWASNINTGSYVSKSTDSIDVTIKIYVFENQKYIPAPEVNIEEFTLIDLDKIDTLKVSYIRCNYTKTLHVFSEITTAFQEIARTDSIEAAKEDFFRERGYFYCSYDIDIRTNKQLKDVKHLLLNLQLNINNEKYKILNCKYKIKEGKTRIYPH